MKLTITQNLEITEPEIHIQCSILDKRLQNLIDYIRQYSFSLIGTKDRQQYSIPLETIYYIDSVDGTTFLYTKTTVYECKETLTSLEQKLINTPFVRISKCCILNLNAMKCVESSFNHRMQVTLKNDEKVIVTRKYIESLKEKL